MGHCLDRQMPRNKGTPLWEGLYAHTGLHTVTADAGSELSGLAAPDPVTNP